MSRKNKAVYVENVKGGYRVWCAVCEEEEHIPIPDSGMPPEALCAWLEDFDKRHRECTAIPIAQQKETSDV